MYKFVGVECLSLPYNFPITTKKQDKIIVNIIV